MPTWLRSRARAGRLMLAAAAVLLPANAHALPTPDLVVGMVNLVPWIVGGLIALAGAAYAALTRLFGRRLGDFASGALLGALVVLVAAIVGWTSDRAQQTHDEKVRNLADYLRCDLGGHEYYQDLRSHRAVRHQEWNRLARFQEIAFADAAEILSRQPDAALIASYETEVQYHSGIPAVEVDGTLRAFEFVRRADLHDRLQQVTAEDLYLVGSDLYDQPVDQYPGLAQTLAKFAHVYRVTDIPHGQRYTQAASGQFQPADTRRLIDWPVRTETWIVDENRVRFPGITTLLGDHEVARHLADPDVVIVVPYSSQWRDPEAYELDYLAKLLSEIDPARLLVIDLNARGITEQLDRQVLRLDGRRFVVVGISKYDWLYSGIDFAFLTWERLGHDPNRFRLLGFSTRLPEAVAIDWLSREERGGIQVLASGFWATLDWLDERLGLAAGAAVLLIAIALRLILFPIGFLETRSRMLRAHIDRRLGEAEPPRWQGAAPALKRLLGVHRGWEIAGTLVTLALLVPAYRVLADAEKPLYEPFLWIHSLSERDVVLGLIVAGLVFVKLALAGSGPRWVPIAGALAFAPILLAIPSAVLVYAFGVLAVTAVQDGIARWSARTALSRALIHS